jgi:serine O-acetyltransferase
MRSNISAFNLIKSDLYRCTSSTGIRSFLKIYFTNAGFKLMFYLRLSKLTQNNMLTKYTLFPFLWIIGRHLMYKFGIGIPYKTDIGYGFKINHFSGIIVNSKSKIGNNVTISHGVTLGKSERGKNEGCPTIGNEVFIGPGAKIIGNITIGDKAVIGANAVITEDIPSGAVVASPKAIVISDAGSQGYVKNLV